MSRCDCSPRPGDVVVVRCCGCAPSNRPRRTLRHVEQPSQPFGAVMMTLDVAVILAPCMASQPRESVRVSGEYVHAPECPEVA